jgi:hypothetical protein
MSYWYYLTSEYFPCYSFTIIIIVKVLHNSLLLIINLHDQFHGIELSSGSIN